MLKKKIHYIPALLTFVLMIISGMTASATDWFPFNTVNRRINLSGNAGYHFDSHVAAAGFGVTVNGFHITIGGVGSCKLPEGKEPSGKNTASAMVQLGYQIPIVKQFRVIPVVGTAAVGKIVYDLENQENRKPGDPEKTKLDMKYKFDAGVHFVFNYRALIFNAAITRYTVFGGIGVEF